MVNTHLERLLVTGASGTLGYNVVRRIASKQPDTQIHVLMRTLNPDLFGDLPGVTTHEVDMLDTVGLAECVQRIRPNAVIHCAASGVRPAVIDYFGMVDLNVGATLNLFRATCDVPACHFIHISTGLVYAQVNRPCRESDGIHTLHPYGSSKAAADCLLRAAAERLGRHLTIIRPFSFTGVHDGGDRLFPSLLRCAAEGKPFDMSPGTQLRDFCAVQDVVDAIVLVLVEGDHPGQDVFNVGSGLSISLGRIVHSVAKQLSLEVEIRLGARDFHPLEPTQLVADISRTQSLGWRPRTNLAYAVWQLAQIQYPKLSVSEPERYR